MESSEQDAAKEAVERIIKTCGYNGLEAEPMKLAFLSGCEWGRMNPISGALQSTEKTELQYAGMFALGYMIGKVEPNVEWPRPIIALAQALKNSGMESPYLDEVLGEPDQ